MSASQDAQKCWYRIPWTEYWNPLRRPTEKWTLCENTILQLDVGLRTGFLALTCGVGVIERSLRSEMKVEVRRVPKW